jgi:NTP pyrophosphatase (non-canonical NTP hydrolase)
MKYQLLTLKLDVRQLFYEGLNMKTEMTQAVNTKTQKLSDEIAELRTSIKKIHTMLNIQLESSLQGTFNKYPVRADRK